MKVQPIYNSKIFKKGLELAANNGALFTSAASLVFATAVRPIAIMSAPKTDKENKKYACIKSISSSAAGFFAAGFRSSPAGCKVLFGGQHLGCVPEHKRWHLFRPQHFYTVRLRRKFLLVS